MHVGAQLVMVVWRHGCAHATTTRFASPFAPEKYLVSLSCISDSVGHRFSWRVLHVYWTGRGKLTRNIFMPAWNLCKVPDPPGSLTALGRFFFAMTLEI